MMPSWFHAIAIIYLICGAASSLVVVSMLVRRPQSMWIMNLVWPITALFGTLAVLALLTAERRDSGDHDHGHASHAKGHGDTPSLPVAAAKGTLHCGAGCTLGDIAAEWLGFLVPAVAVAFGWHWLFEHKIFAVWVLDYLFAYGFGIAFQYFTIKPMRDLSPMEGLVAAIKADTFSLTAWQVGMYGCVALAKFWLFDRVFHTELTTNSVEFWFVMQVAMACGFVTSFPVNVWLVAKGLKERM